MNTSLFLKVYKNKVLNIIINNQIRYIHREVDKNAKKLSWNDLTPEVLSHHGYIDQFKKLDAYDILKCGRSAARNGHIHILKYIYKVNLPNNRKRLKFYSSALEGGNIPIIEYIYDSLDKSNIYHDYLESAAIGGVDACKWVVNHHKDVKKDCLRSRFYENVTLYGNLDSMKWGIHFFKKDKTWVEQDGNILWENAIESKNISLLEFMYNHEQFKSLFDLKHCMFFASKYGNFDVMDWIFSKNDDPLSFDDEKLYSNLLISGSIRVIKYFSGKFGGNNNNIAEWFFNKCEQHGFNAIDYAKYHKKYKILVSLYTLLTNDPT